VYTILRLTTLLHKKILLDLLAPPTSPQTLSPIMLPSNVGLDAFLAQSSKLLAASDDLVSTLYPPQDPLATHTELLAFITVVETLQNGVRGFFRQTSTAALGERLEALTLTETSANANDARGRKDIRIWFDTCFEQIYKASRTFALTLA
jgi:cyclin-D1-binding protein 1